MAFLYVESQAGQIELFEHLSQVFQVVSFRFWKANNVDYVHKITNALKFFPETDGKCFAWIEVQRKALKGNGNYQTVSWSFFNTGLTHFNLLVASIRNT